MERFEGWAAPCANVGAGEEAEGRAGAEAMVARAWARHFGEAVKPATARVLAMWAAYTGCDGAECIDAAVARAAQRGGADPVGDIAALFREWGKGGGEKEVMDDNGMDFENADERAEAALLRAALGYTETVRKPFKLKTVTNNPGEGKREEERIEYANEQVHVPAKITALIYWLKNRRPDRWRDRPESEDGEDDALEEMLENWGEDEGE